MAERLTEAQQDEAENIIIKLYQSDPYNESWSICHFCQGKHNNKQDDPVKGHMSSCPWRQAYEHRNKLGQPTQ